MHYSFYIQREKKKLEHAAKPTHLRERSWPAIRLIHLSKSSNTVFKVVWDFRYGLDAFQTVRAERCLHKVMGIKNICGFANVEVTLA